MNDGRGLPCRPNFVDLVRRLCVAGRGFGASSEGGWRRNARAGPLGAALRGMAPAPATQTVRFLPDGVHIAPSADKMRLSFILSFLVPQSCGRVSYNARIRQMSKVRPHAGRIPAAMKQRRLNASWPVNENAVLSPSRRRRMFPTLKAQRRVGSWGAHRAPLSFGDMGGVYGG